MLKKFWLTFLVVVPAASVFRHDYQVLVPGTALILVASIFAL